MINKTMIINRKIPFFLICMFLISSLCGCSKQELDEMAVVTCLEVIQSEDPALPYTVKAEVLQSQSSDENNPAASEVISTSSESFSKCMKLLDDIESRNLYLGHLRLIILDHAWLSTNTPAVLDEISDYAVKNTQIRFNTMLCTTTPEDSSVIDGETTATGNRGIDLSAQLRDSSAETEISGLINELRYGDGRISFPVASLQSVSDKETVNISPGKSISFDYS